MSGLLHLYRHYFIWQGTMRWTTAIGVGMMLAAAVIPLAPLRIAFLSLGSILAVLFPTVFAGVAYRQLIGNRRFILLPQLRRLAAGALLLLAATAGIVSAVFGFVMTQGEGAAGAIEIGIAIFGIASLYLLLSQWLITRSLGLAAFAIVPIVSIRFVVGEDPILASGPYELSALTGLAGLGWAWLFVSTRNPIMPRAIAAPEWAGGMTSGPEDNPRNARWWPHGGAAATAPGSLLRGVADGLRNRLATLLMLLVTLPLSILAVIYLVAIPLGGTRESGFVPVSFLILSVFGLFAQISFLFAEWAARIRLLWLRAGGGRAGLWRLLERTLLADAGLVVVLAGMIAVACRLLTSLAWHDLWLYVAGCGIASLVGGYLGFWVRAAGYRRLAQVILVLLIMLACLAGMIAIPDMSMGRARVFWLLVPLTLLALVCRALARRRVLGIDWCAIRPARRPRRAAQEKGVRHNF